MYFYSAQQNSLRFRYNPPRERNIVRVDGSHIDAVSLRGSLRAPNTTGNAYYHRWDRVNYTIAPAQSRHDQCMHISAWISNIRL